MLTSVSNVRFGSVVFGGKTLEFEDDSNLFQVLTGAGLMSSEGTCMGGLACGKCLVKVVSGKVPDMEEEEAEVLEGKKDVRLACAIALDDSCNGAAFELA